MTPCQKLGYKVGDNFIVQEDCSGFVKGQIIKLYEDDDSECPLFQGSNERYNLCGDTEGAYLSLDSVTKLVKEEKEEMQFDMKKEPWFIRVTNDQEFNAACDWVEENFGDYLETEYSSNKQGLTNTDDFGEICTHVMWMGEHSFNQTERHEIKVTFKTVIDSVTFPEVKTEQQKQIEELEKTIFLAKQQIEELKKI